MALINQNIQQVEQLMALASQLDSSQYQQAFMLPHSPTIGRHIRHVIEHYVQLLQGKDEGLINYGARARDQQLEQCPRYANKCLDKICQQLHRISSPFAYPLVLQTAEGRLATNLARELDYVFNHTVHHLALVNILLQSAGLTLLGNTDLHPTTREQLTVCVP